MVLRQIEKEKQSFSVLADGDLPSQVGEEARAQTGSKGRFCASKSFAIASIGYFYLVFTALHPPIPNPHKPLIFYSNHLRDDLKLTIIKALKGAKSSISLQIYGLTDSDIIALLQKKQAEGVQVNIFYDKKASKTLPKGLCAYPVQTNGLMHRKILIIDDALIFLGTANFTTQSLRMHHNLIIGAWDPQFACFLRDSIETKGAFHLGNTQLISFFLPDFENQAIDQLGTCIDLAKENIQVAIFTLTHPKLIDKLIQAQKRGVAVTIAIDHYTAQGASQKALDKLQNAGIQVLLSQGSELFHHKWALIDEKILTIGSANWTRAAFEKNQDCLLIFQDLNQAQQKKLRKLWKAIINNSSYPLQASFSTK